MLTVLSAHQLHHEVRTAQLVVLPFEMPGLVRHIGVTTRRAPTCRRAPRALLEEIERASGARSGNWPSRFFSSPPISRLQRLSQPKAIHRRKSKRTLEW
jgi:hypothetical protein